MTWCTPIDITGERSQTDDASVTMFIGPGRDGSPIEIGVVVDDEGEAIIHCMAARSKFLNGWSKP
jgi:hypothetical protein